MIFAFIFLGYSAIGELNNNKEEKIAWKVEKTQKMP